MKVCGACYNMKYRHSSGDHLSAYIPSWCYENIYIEQYGFIYNIRCTKPCILCSNFQIKIISWLTYDYDQNGMEYHNRWSIFPKIGNKFDKLYDYRWNIFCLPPIRNSLVKSYVITGQISSPSGNSNIISVGNQIICN